MRFSTRLLIVLLFLPVAISLADEPEKAKKKDVKLTKRWTPLFLVQGDQHPAQPIPAEFLVENVEKGYSFTGPVPGDQHRLGNYKVDGSFILKEGYLRRELGNSALLRLPEADQFDLEGLMHATGAGGWLILLGWNEEKKSGYCIYNTTLRVSGSKWFICEIKDGKAVPDSDKFLLDRQADGVGALRMRVLKNQLSLQVADDFILLDHALPNYNPGRVMMGTYSPGYGAKNINFKSLRMKAN